MEGKPGGGCFSASVVPRLQVIRCIWAVEEVEVFVVVVHEEYSF